MEKHSLHPLLPSSTTALIHCSCESPSCAVAQLSVLSGHFLTDTNLWDALVGAGAETCLEGADEVQEVPFGSPSPTWYTLG